MHQSMLQQGRDGNLVLALREVEGDWFAVSSPLDPHLHTQARALSEAFEMAREALAAGRAKCHEKIEVAMGAAG